ncbi:MAG: ABC transporter permease [Tannerellaceae bacterium]|nr:ABC transporter permease [Tannerellaceae bacterium]
MIWLYLKQSFQLMREKPYLSFITILGTGLAIGLIMIYLTSHRSFGMDVAPEVNRHRTLYVKWVGVESKETGHWTGTGFLSLKTIRECFQTLELPEGIIVTSPLQPRLASIPGGNQKRSYILFTDDVFWKFHAFHFIEGAPYTKADLDAGIPKIVLGEKLAKHLFGTTEDVVGKQMQLSYHTYTVCGIVTDISPITALSYGHAWVPYSSTRIEASNDPEGITGRFKCQIVARSASDLKAVRAEVEKSVEQYNASFADSRINLFRQPDTKYVEEMRFGAGYPNMEDKYRENVILILLILLVPAVNLSGFTLAGMRDRMAELGVRKAFGGTRRILFGQILAENMLYSLIGGVVGLVLAYIAMFYMNPSVSTTFHGLDVAADTPVWVFMNVQTFLIAFLFCFLLNVLSAGIPAWIVSSRPIVESLKGE